MHGVFKETKPVTKLSNVSKNGRLSTKWVSAYKTRNRPGTLPEPPGTPLITKIRQKNCKKSLQLDDKN